MSSALGPLVGSVDSADFSGKIACSAGLRSAESAFDDRDAGHGDSTDTWVPARSPFSMKLD